MIEWLAFPLVITAAAFLPKRPIKDEIIIKQIFENKRVCIKRGDVLQHPTLKRKIKKEGYDTYIFSMPYGLHTEDIEDVVPAIKEALRKEIEIEVKGYLIMDVFHEALPDKWNYDEELLRPNTWEVPVGKNHKGILYHDFEKYCHLLCGGVTRFGKTVFMKEVMNTLILNNPQEVEIYVLDLKAGLEFYKYKSLPQVKEVACDVFESAELLFTITNDLKKKELVFRDKGYTNIIDTPIKKRTFIFVDEGAELSPGIVKSKEAKQCAEFCQSALSEIARIGGGIGYRLIYATQYPTKEAVPMQVKMNIVARLSFVCASGVASKVLLDQTGAEELPSIPGRGIYMVEKKRTVQVPYIDDKMMFKMMEENKDVIISTTTGGNDSTDHRPARNRKNKTPFRNK